MREDLQLRTSRCHRCCCPAHEPIITYEPGRARCDSRWRTTSVKALQLHLGRFVYFADSSWISRIERADERTRTAFPCSLGVITQALQGCAEGCKCRIFRGVSFPCLAACCTVLRSRWYQCGINMILPP